MEYYNVLTLQSLANYFYLMNIMVSNEHLKRRIGREEYNKIISALTVSLNWLNIIIELLNKSIYWFLLMTYPLFRF